MATGKVGIIAWAVLSVGLITLSAGCTVNLVVPPTDGQDTSGDQTATTGTDPGTTANDSNPNSPCPDQTNIYVSYVNESTAIVTFVESFLDANQGAISKKIVLLRPAGDPQATVSKCIACPWQAGVHNISFAEGETVRVPWPPDLFQGDFKGGDNITFTFKADYTIQTAVETP
jgi:hypothetical protein